VQIEKGKMQILTNLVKSLKRRISVIPAKAGIHLFQILKNSLDSGFHRSDDFLRDHQDSVVPSLNFALGDFELAMAITCLEYFYHFFKKM
jgi:hypothetical protein